MNKKHVIFIAIVSVFFSFFSVYAEEKTLNLSFGVYQSDKATVMYRKFIPVLEFLQVSMEKTLHRSIDIELKIFKTYQQANDALVNQQVDFVRFGPASYALAKERNDAIKLMVMEHKKGKKTFKGLVIVAANSPIKTLTDLKSKTFAFGNKDSTIGRYLVQAELINANIHAKDFKKYDYLGRHDKVFNAIVLGDYDAGAIKSGTYKRYNKTGQVKIIHEFKNITKPWLVREGIDNKIVRAIKMSLLSLDDPSILKELKISGFLETSDEDYQFVRKGMALSKKF